MRLKWNIVHECDDDNGNPTQWASEINHPEYGKYVWIEKGDDCFVIIVADEVDPELNSEIMQCKSLLSAKRWVAINLI